MKMYLVVPYKKMALNTPTQPIQTEFNDRKIFSAPRHSKWLIMWHLIAGTIYMLISPPPSALQEPRFVANYAECEQVPKYGEVDKKNSSDCFYPIDFFSKAIRWIKHLIN